MRKIYVVGKDDEYACWMDGIIVDELKDADLVVFTGGEDVCPFLYNNEVHPETQFNHTRDLYEIEFFQKALKLNKKIIGICRGSQFLCVMAGGILVQHQNNPEYWHKINTVDGKIIDVNSTHHQAQYPFRMDKDSYKILGWSDKVSAYHYGQSYVESLYPPKECEVVFYPKIDALGIQYHPETICGRPYTMEWTKNLLNKFMDNELHD